ncbi:MAG: DUF3379 family protein [Oceanococcus sp.]
MDELEMRRRCIAAPNDPDPAYQEWLNQHPGAKGVALQARHFDERLRFALQDVDIPDGLNGRILLGSSLRTPRRSRQRWLAGFAVAASVLISVGLWFNPSPSVAGGFQQLALNHVYDEIHHFEHPSGGISDSMVSNLFQQVGGQLKGSLGDIKFAFMCPTPSGEGLHLVADNSAGRVTVLYVPNASKGTQAVAFADERFRGSTLLPAAGGALAIIGENPQAVELMEQALDEAVQWQTSNLATDTWEHSYFAV